MSNDYSRLMYKTIIQNTLPYKYSIIPDYIGILYINSLIYGKKCHYYYLYKDLNILYYNDELLKKQYNYKESSNKLPKIAIYYKNYLLFFCRPFYRHPFYNSIVQNFGDNKAEIFYKKNFCISNETKLEKRNNNNGNMNNNVIIFDSKARKSIDDGNILTTIDLCTIHSKNNNNTYSRSDFIKEDEFFTIKTRNDGLIDIINNLTKNSIHKIKYKDSLEDNEEEDNLNNPKNEQNKQFKHIQPKKIKSFGNKSTCSNLYAKHRRLATTSVNNSNINNYSNKGLNLKTSKSPKSSLCNLYKKSNFFGNKSIHNLLLTNNNNVNSCSKSKSKNQKSNNKENTIINSQYRLYSPKFSSKSSLSQFKKCKPKQKIKHSFKSNITEVLKYKYSFQNSIFNCSLNNRTNIIGSCSQNTKNSKSKSNRNKTSASPQRSIGMTYLTHCLNQFKSIKDNTVKTNKLFSLRSTTNNNVNLNTKSSNNSRGKKNKKTHNPLSLNFFNKIPKKSNKNSTNTSKILKSNQSVETLFKKTQYTHSKKDSNLNTNNNSISSNHQHSHKKDINFNVNVNLNNIQININTNNNNVGSEIVSNTNSISKNKSQNNVMQNNYNTCTKHKKNINHTNSNTLLREGKGLNLEMDKIISGIKSNLNTGKMVDGLLYFNNNYLNLCCNNKKSNLVHQLDYLLPNGFKSSKGINSNKKQNKTMQTRQTQNKFTKKGTGRNSKYNKSNI